MEVIFDSLGNFVEFSKPLGFSPQPRTRSELSEFYQPEDFFFLPENQSYLKKFKKQNRNKLPAHRAGLFVIG